MSPYISEYPTSQYVIDPTLISKKFFIAMLTAFLDCVIPVSTSVKPACMKNTKMPDNNIQSIPMSPSTAAVSCIIKGKFKIELIIIIIFYVRIDRLQQLRMKKGYLQFLLGKLQKFLKKQSRF